MSEEQHVADLIRARIQEVTDLPAPSDRRRIRKAAGLSVAEVARIVGVTRGAVDHWERGIRMAPRGDLRGKYVAALNAMREAAS